MKTFIEFFVKKSTFTAILLFALLAVGVNSLMNMPRGEDPEVNFPNYNVIAVLPGASPADMEEQVIDVIEEKLAELDDLTEISSFAEDGLAVIRVQAEFSINREDKYQEIVREVASLRPDLPDNLVKLDVNKFTSSDVNIYQMALVSETASYSTLKKYAEDLEKELEKVNNLKKVETWGYPEREIKVEVNIEKLAQNKIPLNYVINALQSEDLNIPGGSVVAGKRKFNVKTSGEYKSLDEIRNTIVFGAAGKIIYLKDVAEVTDSYEEETHRTRINERRAVLVTAAQKAGENIFAVADKVAPVIEKYQKSLPPSIELIQNFDQSISVKNRLSRLGKDFILAILLVSITLLPLGWRAALVVMISIPLSLSIGLFLLDSLGFTINQLSIVGMIVALGILVDDAIVIVENIERFIRNGYPIRVAVVESTKQIALAVIGVTITLIIAFMPLLNLPEGAGEFIRGLPLAVVTSVSASLLVSLTIVPFLSRYILKAHGNPHGNIFLRALSRGIDLTYSRLMKISLKYPYRALGVSFLIVVLAFLVVTQMGFSLFPKSEKPQFYINIELPSSASFDETDRVTHEIERELAKVKHIRYFTSNIGKGNPQVYYNVIQRNEQSNYANIFVQCDVETAEEKVEIIQSLRKKFSKYTKAQVQVLDYEQGPPLEAPVAIRIFGENLDTLRRIAYQVEDTIKSVEGTNYLFNPMATQQTDLKVEIHKEKAGLLGVQVASIDQTVRIAVAGFQAANLNPGDGEDKIGINVTLARKGFQKADVFERIYVNSVNNAAIPLDQVADIQFQTSPNAIRHLDKQRYTTVNAYAENGYLYSDLNTAIIAKLQNLKLPPGYTWVAAGELENQADSFKGFEVIVILTVFAFIAALVLEFGSLKSTLIVLSVIPLGAIGGIWGLWLNGLTFSFTAMIGFIALIGIEIKNSILLVDYTNQLREQGMPLKEAIEKAGDTRFLPILLTTLTAVGGLIPLVLEPAPLYTPLAWVLIGGLISSLLLSRVVTPILYLLLPPNLEMPQDQQSRQS
ncbi:MAG: efflux RND transporter permease subunit [Microscillaceae bacterium]|nr:efflux RND transporter permease subunit [Microscillaceae bacterium]